MTVGLRSLGEAQNGIRGKFGPISLTTIFGLPRRATNVSISQAKLGPESNMSLTRGQAFVGAVIDVRLHPLAQD